MKEIIESVTSQYGWTTGQEETKFVLLNKLKVEACQVIQNKNRFRIESTGGELLYSGTDLAKAVDTVLSKYFYAQKI